MTTTTKHFGYFVFGKDMNNVDLAKLKKNGVTDIFLNYYAFTAHGESKVASWIQSATKNNINVHIWMQCFYDGNWINPARSNLTSKIKEAKKYAGMKNVKGVHLDYLRYPGDAYKTRGGADAVTEFVSKIRKENPDTFLSCAVMPESQSEYYYGQNIEALGKLVNAVIPMQYKGNYSAGTDWLKTTTTNFSKKANIFSGLQSYKSDDNPTKLSSTELLNDAKTCLNNGASGVILFRYGLSEDINFTSLTSKKGESMATYSYSTILTKAKNIKNSVEKNKKLGEGTKWSYYFAKEIIKPKTNVTKITFEVAPKPAGHSINDKVYKEDYIKIAKHLISFVEKNKRLPNYITWKKKNIRTRDYVYMLARIVVYYNAHKELPNYATVNTGVWTTKSSSSSGSSLKPYITEKGCSGMGQCTGYYCACNSLQQCFYRLTGIKVAESTIASVAGTTTSGTSHQGIETAVAWFNKKYDKKVKITWKNFSDLGSSDSARWSALQNYINKGAVFNHIAYRRTSSFGGWGHYEVPKSVSGDNVIVLNSLGGSCGGSTYCGYIETRSKSTHLYYIQGISQKSIAILTNG